jgi:hypothetical protein
MLHTSYSAKIEYGLPVVGVELQVRQICNYTEFTAFIQYIIPLFAVNMTVSIVILMIGGIIY